LLIRIKLDGPAEIELIIFRVIFYAIGQGGIGRVFQKVAERCFTIIMISTGTDQDQYSGNKGAYFCILVHLQYFINYKAQNYYFWR